MRAPELLMSCDGCGMFSRIIGRRIWTLELLNVRFRKSHHERYFHQTTTRTRCEGG